MEVEEASDSDEAPKTKKDAKALNGKNQLHNTIRLKKKRKKLRKPHKRLVDNKDRSKFSLRNWHIKLPNKI